MEKYKKRTNKSKRKEHISLMLGNGDLKPKVLEKWNNLLMDER